MQLRKSLPTPAAGDARRKGAFLVLGFFALVVCLGFVAFSVDVGMISLTRTQMQNSVDSAALAAAMEITNAVQTAPQGTQNITAYARTAARTKAAEVAGLNGIYVNPNTDVTFGQRTYNATTKKFTINWGIGASDPANCVKVTARKENSDQSSPDAQMKLFFAGVMGSKTANVRTEAVAYVEARDLVVVHDFSRSMNFDSYFADEASTRLSDAQIVANLQDTYSDLGPPNLGTMTFTPQWLTMTRTNPNISVTFRLTSLDASTSNDMKSIKLQFTNKSQQSFTPGNNEKKAKTVAGTGTYSGRNIDSCWVTVSVPRQQTTTGGAVTQSGTPTVTATFASNKKSVAINSSSTLQQVQLQFTDNNTQTIDFAQKTGTVQGSGGNSGKTLSAVRVKYSNSWKNWINMPADQTTTVYQDEEYEFQDSNANVIAAFGLNSVSYPYPVGSWDEYVTFVRNNAGLAAAGYTEKYGGLTFVDYLLRNRSSHAETPALATARHYPFTAIKSGHILLCDFLKTLGFDDHIGMVSYDTQHRIEKVLNETGLPLVNISSAPLSVNYDAVANLMRYKQANHYYPSTNIAGGMIDAISLMDNHKRSGARPNIILMTDGNANITEGSSSLPSGWEGWFTGYNGVGSSYSVNYGSSSEITARKALLNQVHSAVLKGYTIHTISVGVDGDQQVMKAIAFHAGGEFINVPGGSSVEEMEAQMLAAFHKIAGLVPPAKLLGPYDQ